MTTRRRKGWSEPEPEKDNSERWMASYMDMVTVLMCMFIVLFAMSTVDAEKYEQLKNALATGFGLTASDTVDTASGVVVPAEAVTETTGSDSDQLEVLTDGDELMEAALGEVDRFEELKKQINASLAEIGLESSVRYTVDDRGLTVRLVGSQTFFNPNSAQLSANARLVLESMTPILATSPYQIAIEGHADRHGSPAPFATDWELSSARATAVLRRMVEVGGMPGDRIRAIGFGSERPLTEGTTRAERSENRRVDIVVLSNQPEEVRKLMPSIIEHLDES